VTEIYLDSANIKEINKYQSWGIITGITTNQKIFLKEKGCNFEERARQILDISPYPVSLEGPNDYDELIVEAERYHNWKNDIGQSFKNIVIKVPMLKNGDGLRAVKTLRDKGIKTNVTACMTINQAFLAACAGADYVSLFYNRMKDWSYKLNKNEQVARNYALYVIQETMKTFKDFDIKTKLIVGSIRSPEDIEDILLVKPDIITIPPAILEKMPINKKTEETLKEFEKAWKEFKKAEK